MTSGSDTHDSVVKLQVPALVVCVVTRRVRRETGQDEVKDSASRFEQSLEYPSRLGLRPQYQTSADIPRDANGRSLSGLAAGRGAVGVVLAVLLFRGLVAGPVLIGGDSPGFPGCGGAGFDRVWSFCHDAELFTHVVET